MVQKQLDPNINRVECTYKRRLYGPDGNRYHCVYGIMTHNPSYIVNYHKLESVKICENYTECSPCDEIAKIRFIK